jgi:hypothetical protein
MDPRANQWTFLRDKNTNQECSEDPGCSESDALDKSAARIRIRGLRASAAK